MTGRVGESTDYFQWQQPWQWGKWQACTVFKDLSRNKLLKVKAGEKNLFLVLISHSILSLLASKLIHFLCSSHFLYGDDSQISISNPNYSSIPNLHFVLILGLEALLLYHQKFKMLTGLWKVKKVETFRIDGWVN